MGVCGRSPKWGSGQRPWSGVSGRSPPEAETLLVFGRLLKVSNLPTFKQNLKRKKSDRVCVVFSNDVYRPQYVTDYCTA